MPLNSLADVADLPDAWQADPNVARALAIASEVIREAAGSAIGRLTSTITVTGHDGRLLRLPGPVTAVASVLVDGTAVTDYRVLPEGLWRYCGWSRGYRDWAGGSGPVAVVVTLTYGLVNIPADVVDLCAQLATAWLQHNDSGGGSTAGLTSVKLDDAAETYSDESSGQVSPVFIPAATRAWLAARFGGGTAVVETA